MAETLREARQRLGVGVRRLSKGAPVSPRTIYQVERGETSPQSETIRKMARFLGVDPMEITEFADSLKAQGYDALPEEPEALIASPPVARAERASNAPREQALADLRRLMQDVGRLDSARVYREVFDEEPPG